jgi:hypothetical protein
MDLVGPHSLSMMEVVALFRRWLGWRPACGIRLSPAFAGMLYHLGDFTRLLGWRPALGSTARRELPHGAVGDPRTWQNQTGILPEALTEALCRNPASVQERWFARLYFLKPLGFVVYSLFWLITGVISLTLGYPSGVALMQEGGAGALSGPAVIAGAIADMVIGIAISFRPTTRLALYGAIALTCFYVVAGTILVPRLWADPLGPFTKIFPIMVFNLMLLAILEER